MIDILEWPPTPIFPEKISNTQRSMFRTCPQKWYWAYCLRGRKSMARGVDLIAGGAFAKGLEVARKCFFDEGLDSEDAIEEGVAAASLEYGDDPFDGHKKSRSKTLGAVYAYFNHWRLDMDYLHPFKTGAGTGIEFRFAVPLPIEHPYLQQPLLYDGRVDMIAEHKDIKGLWIVDEKTTTQLGASWRKKWYLDAQPTGYIWAGAQHGYHVAGALIRGISFLSNSYGFEEALCPRTEFQVEDWFEQLQRDIKGMICTFNDASGAFGTPRRPDRALDKDACAAYGGCTFLQPCSANNPEVWLKDILNPPENAALPEGDALLSLFE